MKTLIFLLLITTTISAQMYSVQGQNVPRTCIVCGYEWDEWQSSYDTSLSGSLRFYPTDEMRGQEWFVVLHQEPYLCEHCYNLYAEKWRKTLESDFNLLLNTAIEEQKGRAEKVSRESIKKRQFELNEKIKELQREIEDLKERGAK